MAPFVPDRAQQRVLDHADGPLFVDGGFGTGKTVTLRERFARLVAGGADPERVALVVGSRRARDEARDALLARLDLALPQLNVVTMHGLAFHVVGSRYAALGYEAPPTVLSAAEQFGRVRELLEGEDPARWPAYGSLLRLRGFADEVRQFVTRAQESLRSPEDLERTAAARGLSGWNELAAFLRTYLDVLDAASEVDFAGLLVRAATAAADGAPPFDHVLVDDFQDTTLAADALIAALRPTSLVIAGNLEAHVFSFQGTTDEPLRRFAERAERVVFDTHHRPAPDAVDAWRAPHPSEEHAAIARELRRIHVEDGVAWRDLAVVVRRFGSRTSGLLRALDDAGVPRSTSSSGSPATISATRPFVLALRWIVAPPERRDGLVESLLTSELGRISPASARTFLRLLRAYGHPRHTALAHAELATDPEDVASLATLAEILRRAEEKRTSALDAFAVLWKELPFARELVAAAETDEQAAADVDAIVGFSRSLGEAGGEADPSVEAFLAALDAAQGGPELAATDSARDEVAVLTAHAAAGRSFDTVIVLGALEGDFPSLTRPEPMFDLAALDRTRSRSEVNRERLADERRLFTMVRHRASRRVLLTATDPHGAADAVTLTSRFVEELGVPWHDAPTPGAVREPVSVREAIALWRRTGGDPTMARVERLAALEGLLALGEDPARWWFQRDWTDGGERTDEPLRLSYSRLDTLENCELQFVLSTELGLDPGGGYQAWVGRLVHQIIEDIENGKVERSRAGFRRALEDRWEESRFPSYAISDAELHHAQTDVVDNWFGRYGDTPAHATEQVFEFELEGAVIRGKIDRIGPVDGETRITDYKTGKADNAGPPAQSLQLGIYYLAVNEVDALEPHRPIAAVELAFLGGKRGDEDHIVVKDWTIEQGDAELEYATRMRERVSDLIRRVRELEIARTYVADTGANCFFCRFQTLCARYPQGAPVFPVETVVRAEATAP